MYDHSKRSIKKHKRKENKKNKLKALLEISQLNDQDRKKLSEKKTCHELSCELPTKNGEAASSESPDPKRMKPMFLFPLNGTEKLKEDYVKPEKTEFTAEQRAHLAKLLKKRKMIRKERPYLELSEVGEAADITLPESRRVPLSFEDFQHFIISSLLAHMSTKGPCRWIQVKKLSKIQRRIFLIIEGVGLKEYLDNKKDLKTLSMFEKRLEVTSPAQYGGNLVSELSLVSFTRSQKDRFTLEYGSWESAKFSGDLMSKFRAIFPIANSTTKSPSPKPEMTLALSVNRRNDNFSRKDLVLTPWEMSEENYPMPFNSKSDQGYVPTRDEYDEVSDDSPMWGVDCEMCQTRNGSELTRVCIVDEDANIVYETLVKPYEPIINYLTQYSGITHEMLKNVRTRIEDVQQDIRAICPPNVILVGQSLNMDLHALKLVHPYVIDTSRIFNLTGVPYRKTKLKILVEEFLSLRIQTGEQLGHSPIEDALAALMLVQAKLAHSISWGNAMLSGPRPREESESARMLLEAREAAGMARISTSDSKRLKWPQLENLKRNRGGRWVNGTQDRFGGSPIEKKTQVKVTEECATSIFTHLVRHENNALLVAKSTQLEMWSQSYENVRSDRFHLKEVTTTKGAVRYARDQTPIHGTSIAHVSLPTDDPRKSIIKADKLVTKLMKEPAGNTLYTCLLTGSAPDQGNAMALLHLCREAVPMIPFQSF